MTCVCKTVAVKCRLAITQVQVRLQPATDVKWLNCNNIAVDCNYDNTLHYVLSPLMGCPKKKKKNQTLDFQLHSRMQISKLSTKNRK